MFKNQSNQRVGQGRQIPFNSPAKLLLGTQFLAQFKWRVQTRKDKRWTSSLTFVFILQAAMPSLSTSLCSIVISFVSDSAAEDCGGEPYLCRAGPGEANSWTQGIT